MLDKELNRLVELINNREAIKACYIPSLIWPQIKGLKCSKILAAPDIVFYDFPTQFSGVGEVHLKKAEGIIDRYLLSNYLPISSLYNINIKKIDYVIYSSQYRPHKNIFNLIKAIKIINKEMHCNVKLIITSEFRENQRIMSYINDNHLANDIFIMHGLSSEVLASFNAHANCAVHSTLFEGGFPFAFSEAYSVGTPSVMSNIPVVRAEIYDENLSQMMLFDLYIPYSMAKKIWAVEYCDELYQEQSKLYDKFAQRDWEKVVNEYIQVFEKFMRQRCYDEKSVLSIFIMFALIVVQTSYLQAETESDVVITSSSSKEQFNSILNIDLEILFNNTGLYNEKVLCSYH